MSEADTSEKIYSSLADDEDLREIVAMFVAEMPDRIAKLETEFVEQNWSELQRTAHQLKGAAGSYGFTKISPVAAKLEILLRTNASIDEISDAKNLLVRLCRQVTPEPMNQ